MLTNIGFTHFKIISTVCMSNSAFMFYAFFCIYFNQI